MANKKNVPGSGTIRKKTVTRNGHEYTYWEGRITVGWDAGTGKQKQRSFSGKTAKEVREKMQAAAVELSEKTYQEPDKMTLSEWLDKWEAVYLAKVKPLTVASYHTVINTHIKPALGAVKLQALTTDDIQTFYRSLEKETKERKALSPKTIKNVHGVLHRALNKAVEVKHIRFNPAAACELPKVVKKEIAPIDAPEIPAFLEAIQGHRFETLYTVTLFTGMREGEALGLKWKCVDFKSGTIRIDKQLQKEKKKGGKLDFVPLKNDKTRTITPAPMVMQLLKRHRAEQIETRFKACELWQENDLVFSDEIGRPLIAHTVYMNFKRIAEKMGRPDLRFHDLRHSYAVASIRAGDDVKTVQGNLGHATATFTLDVYGHVTEQMKRDSADRMEQYIKTITG